jgi:hypothetical protein
LRPRDSGEQSDLSGDCHFRRTNKPRSRCWSTACPSASCSRSLEFPETRLFPRPEFPYAIAARDPIIWLIPTRTIKLTPGRVCDQNYPHPSAMATDITLGARLPPQPERRVPLSTGRALDHSSEGLPSGIEVKFPAEPLDREFEAQRAGRPNSWSSHTRSSARSRGTAAASEPPVLASSTLNGS